MSEALDHYRGAAAGRARLMLDTAKGTLSGGGLSLLAARAGASSWLGRLGGQSSQLHNHAEQYRHNTGWVYAVVRAIAQRCAGQPIRVARRLAAPELDQEPPVQKARRRAAFARREYVPKYLHSTQDSLELLDGHQILDVAERPNPLMVRWALLYVTVASLEITGKAYWWLYPGGRDDGLPWSVMPLPSSWLTPVHQDNRLYAAWDIQAGDAAARPVRVPGRQIVYMYYPDPANPLAALSPLQAAARAVLADESIAEAHRRMFQNGIWPGLAIRVKRGPAVNGQEGEAPELTKAQRDQIIEQIYQLYRGVANYDAPLILDAMIDSVTRISNTPREMDFLRSKGLTKDEICQIFGVNPIILGQVEGANRASSTQAEAHFLSSCINPKLELLSQIWTGQVAPLLAPGQRLLMYSEPAVVQDPEFELERQKAMSDRAALEINEFRLANGYTAKPGGAVAMVPSTMKPYDLTVPYTPPAPAPAPGGGPPAPAGPGDLFGADEIAAAGGGSLASPGKSEEEHALGGAGGAPTPLEGKPARDWRRQALADLGWCGGA